MARKTNQARRAKELRDMKAARRIQANAFAEAVARTGMTAEDYLAQRLHASPRHLRAIQAAEMAI